jgi:hypothetical protein
MAITLGTDPFLPLLSEDMIEAWELVQVHYDSPQIPGSGDVLPRGFIEQQDVEPLPRSFSRKVYLHPFRLVGQFRYPDEGTLEESRKTRAQELLDVLTVGATIYKDEHIPGRDGSLRASAAVG